jgi:hypothetical protein
MARVSHWPWTRREVAWERMGWQDGLARWADHQIEQHRAFERWLELHFHAIGLHGPAVRHLLKTRVMPAAILVLATMLLLIAALMVRRLRRSRARRGRAAIQMHRPQPG